MSFPYTLVSNGDGNKVVSVFTGTEILVAQSDHPNFDTILDRLTNGLRMDEDFEGLFDIAETVRQSFENLSERVSVANGRVYFDGDEIHGVITDHILRFLDDDEELTPVVNFLENVMQNPEPHSRENLYRWLQADAAGFTIDQYGFIVGYKGIALDDQGLPVSIHSGRAIVDGEVVEGRIPNTEGSIIEMPRSGVAFDPSLGCSYGLHVGTWSYANSFGNGGTLEVRVNPRDVVSVPTDSGDQKMRVCRYEVVRLISEPYASPVLSDDEFGYEGERLWGDGEDEDALYC